MKISPVCINVAKLDYEELGKLYFDQKTIKTRLWLKKIIVDLGIFTFNY